MNQVLEHLIEIPFYTLAMASDMTSSTHLNEAIENIYTSLHDDNRNLDTHITALKTALAASGQKSVEMDTARIYQNNRQGRKLMQSYFKKRGVIVTFPAKEE